MIYWAILNICQNEDPAFAAKVICETCVSDSYTQLHQACDRVPQEVQDLIFCSILKIVKCCKLEESISESFLNLAVKEFTNNKFGISSFAALAADVIGAILKNKSDFVKLPCIENQNLIKTLVGVLGSNENQNLVKNVLYALSMIATGYSI